ncbi:GGDEF domain-containing protein [Oribacterium sp. WCC10]|uniref:GGDEF domain-containing protein n=1 Tax=Oribacterium sp. WCC10 TaxID=1855343 RepID=UPI000B856D2A|nr:GGDEF domain-containing protein [Oribacterium sp. WCC10]
MPNEYAILYFEINLFSLILIGIILFKTRGLSKMVAQTHFAISIIAEMVFFASDTLFVLIYEGILPGGRFVLMTCKELYFLSTELMCFFWFLYFEYLRETTFVKKRNHVMYSTSLLWLLVILLLTNPIGKSLFYFDAGGEYHRGPLFILTYVLSYSYVVIAFIRAMINIFKETDESNKEFLIKLCLFPIGPGISGILQFVQPRIPVACVAISLSTFFLYLTWIDQLISLDPLTGLNNRKQLTHGFESLSKSAGEHDSIWLYLIDVNHFKQINDTFGHLQGDKALKIIAETLKAACKGMDKGTVIARFGGDEFVILVPGNSEYESNMLKNTINDKLKELSSKKSIPFELTVSIGVAKAEAGESLKDLLSRADEAMYIEKKAGKSQAMNLNQR